MRATVEDRTFQYGDEDGKRITVQARRVPLEICDNCGERYVGPEAARVEYDAICRTLGLPTPAEIVSLRQRLRLSQAALAKLTGIGKATISRWERARMLPNPAMARYLRLLDANPGNVKLLKKLAVPAKAKKRLSRAG